MSRIVELASLIQQRTADINTYLEQNDLPAPTFDEDSSLDLSTSTGEIEKARSEVLEATLELHDLILGPGLCLRPVYNGTSLQAIYKYDIASKVPFHGEISFAELATKCSLSEANIRRMLRYAMAFHRVFKEPRNGFVSHTAASRKLVEDPHSLDGIGYMFDEVWQAYAHTLPALQQFQSDEPTKSGWSHYHKTDEPIWKYYASHPGMAKRFAGAMSNFTTSHGNSPLSLVNHYPWDKIGKGTVVDVGGSKGNVSILLAQKYPDLNFVVQDLPDMIAGVSETLPSDLKGRVEFQEHDFFIEQPTGIHGNVYLFRNIFHNWSDSHCVRILKTLVPSLRPGDRIVINDYVLPEPNTMPMMKERALREMDMIMLTLFNAREREKAHWIDLFKEVDARLSNVKVWVPKGATMGIMEIVWEG